MSECNIIQAPLKAKEHGLLFLEVHQLEQLAFIGHGCLEIRLRKTVVLKSLYYWPWLQNAVIVDQEDKRRLNRAVWCNFKLCRKCPIIPITQFWVKFVYNEPIMYRSLAVVSRNTLNKLHNNIGHNNSLYLPLPTSARRLTLCSITASLQLALYNLQLQQQQHARV